MMMMRRRMVTSTTRDVLRRMTMMMPVLATIAAASASSREKTPVGRVIVAVVEMEMVVSTATERKQAPPSMPWKKTKTKKAMAKSRGTQIGRVGKRHRRGQIRYQHYQQRRQQQEKTRPRWYRRYTPGTAICLVSSSRALKGCGRLPARDSRALELPSSWMAMTMKMEMMMTTMMYLVPSPPMERSARHRLRRSVSSTVGARDSRAPNSSARSSSSKQDRHSYFQTLLLLLIMMMMTTRRPRASSTRVASRA